MAVNSSSSSSNDSILQTYLPLGSYCLFTREGSFVFTSFLVTNILLLLPLFLFVLYLGFQRWVQQRSTSTAATTSHSDSFTYHMVTMDLIGLFGCTLCSSGIHGHHVTIFRVGYYLWSLIWYGETFFHMLTCVERYLAVVHPVTYLNLRRERGVRIRKVTLMCAWLLIIGATTLTVISAYYLIVYFGLLVLSLIIVTYCSISVLCVLIRPGPGEQGGDRERVDQSKRRAFYTISAILGVLMLRIFGSLVWAVLHVLGEESQCKIATANIWINIPSSLVLPLLFLHRAGTLACCKTTPNKVNKG